MILLSLSYFDVTNEKVELNYTDSTTWLASAESLIIEAVLKKERFNQVRTARNLGISRGTLRTKLKEYFGTKYIA